MGSNKIIIFLFIYLINITFSSMILVPQVSNGEEDCKQEFDKKCQKQVDALKKAVEDTSVIGIIKASVDLVQCVSENMDDLWQHCKPWEKPTIGETKKADMFVSIVKMNTKFRGVLEDSECKSEFDKKCGQTVDDLKKSY